MKEAHLEQFNRQLPAQWDVAVIGGSAAGLMAAIGAAETAKKAGNRERHILVLDAGRRPGAKILVTGNGRCNLTNLHLNEECYYTDGAVSPCRLLENRSAAWLMDFFTRRGIPLHDRNGYVYPQTDQAATIAAVLQQELRRKGITYAGGTRVISAEQAPDGSGRFLLRTAEGQTIRSDKLILCTGGKVNAGYGCDGTGYQLARHFGHRIVAPIPALCSLTTDLPGWKKLAGVRAEGSVELRIEGDSVRTETGSLQLTREGISGIPVFCISRLAGRGLEAGKAVTAVLNFLPGRTGAEADAAAKAHLDQMQPEDTLFSVFLGMGNEKLVSWILDRHGLVAEQKVKRLGSREDAAAVLRPLFQEFRHLTVPVRGTGDFDTAQVTAGGVPLEEVDPDTMESRRQRGLYLAGELLDADGICGGYNLTFAMCTGYTAGYSAMGFE